MFAYFQINNICRDWYFAVVVSMRGYLIVISIKLTITVQG